MPLLFFFPTARFFPELSCSKVSREFCITELQCLFCPQNTSLDNIINNDIYWLWGDRRLSAFQCFPNLCVLILQSAISGKLSQRGKKKPLIEHLSSSFDFQFPISALLYFKCKHQLYFNKTSLFAILLFWHINEIMYLSIHISLLVTLLLLFATGFPSCFSSYLQYKPLTWKSPLMCDMFF